MRATYSPEDNKLRIYPSGTRVDSILDDDEYKEFKAAGYKWAAKQECFVAPRWTPDAEDWALDLADEIEDEDYSPEERSADRAERFNDYRDKRRGEAGGHADTFAAGPSAFGHQNRSRAERQAARHDRHRGRALTQWGKAEYWQHRTAGVIAHALFRSSPEVRRGRLLRLEAEYRRHRYMSDRWKAHYELRIEYEKAMLANEGGMAADVEMEVGGWIGRHQIHRVNKSTVTGRVVSVGIWGPHGWRERDGQPEMGIQVVNIERLGTDVYRPPTDEERAAFAVATKERKAKEKASKPKAPELLNPTPEDAERLMAIWNVKQKAIHDKKAGNTERYTFNEYKPTTVLLMTQEEYSARSKGTYASCETRMLHACGRISRKTSNLWTSEGSAYDKSLGETVCKIRTRSSSGWHNPEHIVVLTDKPQKPLPVEWERVLQLIAPPQPLTSAAG